MSHEKLIHPVMPIRNILCTSQGLCHHSPNRRIIQFHRLEMAATVALLVTSAIIDQKYHKVGVLLASPDKVSCPAKSGLYFGALGIYRRGSRLLGDLGHHRNAGRAHYPYHNGVCDLESGKRDEYGRCQEEAPMFMPN